MKFSEKVPTYHKKYHFFDSESSQINQGFPKSSEKPVVLILHGLFGGLSNFDSVISQLSHIYRFVVIHLPLFDSDQLQHIAQLSAYVFRFCEEQLHGKRVHLIGNSLGGQISLHFAHKHPNLVESIVLTGSAGLQENHFGCSTPKRFDVNYLKDRVAEVFFETRLSDDDISAIQSVITSPVRCHRLITLAKNSKKTNLKTILPHIQQPVLLIWGEQDKITPPQTAREFLHVLPNAQLKWISRCGHAPMMEQPELFAQYCDEFFSTLAHNFKQKHLIENLYE